MTDETYPENADIENMSPEAVSILVQALHKVLFPEFDHGSPADRKLIARDALLKKAEEYRRKHGHWPYRDQALDFLQEQCGLQAREAQAVYKDVPITMRHKVGRGSGRGKNLIPLGN